MDALKNEIADNIQQKFPDIKEVHITKSVSTNGVSWCNSVRFSGGYSDHHRAFELTACPAKDMDLIVLSDLADDPLADYFVGSLRMVTLKRYIHV